MTKKIVAMFMAVIMALSIMPINAFAQTNADGKEIFTIEKILGATQKDAIVNGQRRVIYCMQYDNLWPTTNEDAANAKTKYWEASADEMLLDEEQTAIIQRVLYAGYPYDAKGILAPMYDVMGSFADDPASDLTQAVVWSLMAKWGISSNTHYNSENTEFDEDMEEWENVYNALMEYALNGDLISDIPENFVPQLEGSTVLNADTLTTEELKITNPDGFKVAYNVTVPKGVIVLDSDKAEIFPEWDFIDGEFVTTGYTIYGGDTFYLMAENIDMALAGDVTITGSVKIPTDFKQYNTNDTGRGNKNDGQGYVQHPFQTMLSMGVNSVSFETTRKLKATPGTASLEILKLVSAGSPADQVFTINVTLKNYGDKTEYDCVRTNNSANVIHSDEEKLTISNDVLSFTIHGNEAVEINGIPEGAKFTVNEQLEENSKWSAEYKGHTSETVEADEEYELTITNTYNYTAATADITATKTLKTDSGASMSMTDGQFSFKMIPADEHSQATMPNGAAEVIVENEADGKIDFGKLTFTKPGTYKYVLEEENVTAANIERDTRYFEVDFTVEANNGKLEVNGPVYSVHENGSSDSVQAVEFVNKYVPAETFISFSVDKKVHNNSSDREIPEAGYQFIIQPADENATYPEFADGNTSITITTDENGIAISPELEIDEALFHTIFGSEASEGALDYTISEVVPPDNGKVPGITYAEDKIVTVLVKLQKESDNSEVKMSSIITYDDKADFPEFINQYTATGSATLKVNKAFTPQDYTPAQGESYTFAIKREAKYDGVEEEITPITLTYDNDQWKQTGGEIKFTKAGIYGFEIYEEDSNDINIVKDHTHYLATIVVTDNGTGTLDTSITYSHAGAVLPEAPTFTNTYNFIPEPVQAPLTISKTLENREWLKGETFIATIREANVTQSNNVTSIDHAHHVADVELHNGKNEFPGVQFDQVGTYHLVVSEIRSNDPAVKADDSVYVVEYKVTLENTELEVTSTIYLLNNGQLEEVNGVQFTNTAKVTDLSVSKTVVDDSKTLDLTAASYELQIKLHSLTNPSHIVDGTYGDITFVDGVATVELKNGETATAEGLPQGFEFMVEELDTDGYTVEINGEKATSIAGVLGEDGAEINVINTYITANPTPSQSPETSPEPGATSTPAPTTTPAPSQPANSNTANTGDSFNAVGLVALLVVSAIAVVALLILRKKNSK